MRGKKLKSIAFCAIAVTMLMTGCNPGKTASRAGEAASETISRIESDTSKTMSKAREKASEVGSRLERDASNTMSGVEDDLKS